MGTEVHFHLNGQPVVLDTPGERSLLSVLRVDLGLTGAKYGCGIGACGACPVLIDGHPARACRHTLRDVDGRQVTTIEGLASSGHLHPLQQAFIDHGAVQCGFCTPGMILTAQALLAAGQADSRAQIGAGLEHNLCRCGAHPRILDAVEAVAAQGRTR